MATILHHNGVLGLAAPPFSEEDESTLSVQQVNDEVSKLFVDIDTVRITEEAAKAIQALPVVSAEDYMHNDNYTSALIVKLADYRDANGDISQRNVISWLTRTANIATVVKSTCVIAEDGDAAELLSKFNPTDVELPEPFIEMADKLIEESA